jgi:hypothetical protein
METYRYSFPHQSLNCLLLSTFIGFRLTEAYSTRLHTKYQAQKIDSIAFSGYTTSYGYAVHIGACLEVDDDGHAVDADEGLLINGAAVDSVRVAVITVSVV